MSKELFVNYITVMNKLDIEIKILRVYDHQTIKYIVLILFEVVQKKLK